MKSTALQNIFTSAAEITDKVLQENLTSEPTSSLPASINLTRAANRHCQHICPKDPTSLDFELAVDSIPEGFFRKDVTVGDHCHLLFATDRMIELLTISQSWGIDATFKVIKCPFTQLLSIHAFFSSGAIESRFHFFLLSCLANENVTTRKCSGQPSTYSHQFACSPSPSTLRQLCGRHFIEYYQLWPSMAVSFTGPKLCGERLKSWDYRWHTTQTTTLTSSSKSCSLFHTCLLNTSNPSSPNFKKKP